MIPFGRNSVRNWSPDMMSALQGAIECFCEGSRSCGSVCQRHVGHVDSRVDCIEPITSKSTDKGFNYLTGSYMSEYMSGLQMGFLVSP
jgi:hypothetical protein